MKSPYLYSALHLSIMAAVLATPSVSAAQDEEQARLESVVVTANRRESALLHAPASISVVTQEELKLQDADDLADAIEHEPGIYLTDTSMTRRGISIRGMPQEHTLYLIDGRRISSSNAVIAHSDYELSWLPASAIQRIEVVRGPMSSLYGSDALGGVVNVITRIPEDKIGGEVSLNTSTLGEGSDGAVNKSSFYVAGPASESLSFSLAGQLYDRNNLPSEDDEQISELEARESASGRGELIWKASENHQLSLSYSSSHDKRERDTSSSSAGYYTYKDDIERTQAGLGYDGNFDWGHARVDVYQSKVTRDNRRTNGVSASDPQDVKDQIIEGHIGMPLAAGKHFVTLGGQLREETLYDIDAASDGDTSATHQSVFAQDEIQIGADLQVTAGVGVDNHEEYGNEVSPRVYAVYDLSDSLIIKGGYGEGFRAPSLTELSEEYEVLGGGSRFWVEGNPDLEPERSKTYEAGIEYHQQSILASARIFRNDLQDLVHSVCYTDCGVRGSERRQYENVDESLIRGVELAFSGDLTDSLNLDINSTLLDAVNSGDHEPLEERPRYVANLKLNWRFAHDSVVSWRSEFVGKQYIDEEYAPKYNLHHIDFSARVIPNLKVYAGVDNLFDKRLADESDLFARVEPGRELRFGLTAEF
ncbi:MAG: TonB-dependent receptor [Pseudomonadota bacterium]|nr:TonB-dependent receptor [Pseudomonadota bacterium]